MVASTRLTQIEDGIFGSIARMHTREIAAAMSAVQIFLGTDTLAEKRRAEFQGLHPNEQNEMKSNRDLGPYGAFSLYGQETVSLALSVVGLEVAHEEHKPFKLHATFAAALKTPAKVDEISKRFPAITPDRIARALTLA